MDAEAGRGRADFQLMRCWCRARGKRVRAQMPSSKDEDTPLSPAFAGSSPLRRAKARSTGEQAAEEPSKPSGGAGRFRAKAPISTDAPNGTPAPTRESPVVPSRGADARTPAPEIQGSPAPVLREVQGFFPFLLDAVARRMGMSASAKVELRARAAQRPCTAFSVFSKDSAARSASAAPHYT